MTHRMPQRIQQFAFLGLVVLILVSIGSAFAATNTVPPSRLTDQKRTITVNDLKPAACASLNLTAIVVCPSAGGACNGTTANELILGSSSIDNIQGDKGDDCILGGGGDDPAIRGDQGTDVCIGGPGTDSFHPSCETQIQ